MHREPSPVHMIILVAVSVMAWIFGITGRKLNRAEGAVMCAAYLGVMAFAIIR